MKKISFSLIVLFFLGLSTIQSQNKSIKNGVKWVDTNGNKVHANGGNIINHNGIYYIIGEDYSYSKTGYQGVNLYASKDLINWEFKNKIIDRNTNPDIKNGTRFTERSSLLFNPNTNQFVIWAHYEDKKYKTREAAVFYSNTIDGKYTFHKSLKPFGNDSLDCNVFRDGNEAYFISEDRNAGDLKLYKLSTDFLDVVEVTASIANNGTYKEAPVIFKKNDTYFLLASELTGWNPNQGSYTYSNSLKKGWANWKNFGGKITHDTQPTAVIIINGSKENSFYYVGDRWQDPSNSLAKNIICPLYVNTTNKTISLKYVPEFTINQKTGSWKIYDESIYIPQDNWKLIAVSSEAKNFPATNAFDNDTNTIWHSNWLKKSDSFPYEIIIDLGKKYDVTGFVYIPRLDDEFYGIIRNFELYLSEDGNNWGNPVAAEALSYWSKILFKKTTAKFIKFVAKSEIMNNANSASIAEIKLITSN
ncbi:discoidin domain-containing protein [Polaribacter aestuariivivens]|uniref:discoidin domain-containing protein n=1 Tax=Polaribacter aestuariivivens TaxID=2304626 RepID=UPI003F49854E